jgi:hypothetical protein
MKRADPQRVGRVLLGLAHDARRAHECAALAQRIHTARPLRPAERAALRALMGTHLRRVRTRLRLLP